MNWEAIGAIAELLGAIGVIASLVYLATQIRHSREQMSQNTRAMKAGAYQQTSDGLSDTINIAVSTPGFARIVRSAIANFEGLSEDDAFQFGFWFNNLMRNYDNIYYQYRAGMLEDNRWEMHRADIVTFFTAPGIVAWWRFTSPSRSGIDPGRAGGAQFSPEFVALVSEILGEEPER
jgi:hypothetical protein